MVIKVQDAAALDHEKKTKGKLLLQKEELVVGEVPYYDVKCEGKHDLTKEWTATKILVAATTHGVLKVKYKWRGV